MGLKKGEGEEKDEYLQSIYFSLVIVLGMLHTILLNP